MQTHYAGVGALNPAQLSSEHHGWGKHPRKAHFSSENSGPCLRLPSALDVNLLCSLFQGIPFPLKSWFSSTLEFQNAMLFIELGSKVLLQLQPACSDTCYRIDNFAVSLQVRVISYLDLSYDWLINWGLRVEIKSIHCRFLMVCHIS